MTNFCLPPEDADKFKKYLISGKLHPEKLAEMTSAERHAAFAEVLGDSYAGPVNALFESKLLLKNRQAGMINWAMRVMGAKSVAGKDVISRIQRMDRVLNPDEEKAFLEDLAEQKLGTKINYSEASKIAELSKKVRETKEAMENGGDRMDYGRAAVDLHDYVSDLKNKANGLKLSDFKSNPAKAAMKATNIVASNAKSIKASLDNSAIFRQGWRPMMTHPDIWARNAANSFRDIVRTFGKTKVLKELNADITSRPNADLYRKAKLAVGLNEEAFPTSLPAKIPLLGKFYEASENAFTGFVQRTRADVFDKYIEIAKKSGVDIEDPQQIQSIGKLVNSLTGRGNLGKLEPVADVVNNLFFAPRSVKSHMDTLTAHAFDGSSSFAKKQAAINLLKIIAGTAAVLSIARAVKKDSVELDPRSADFGKIKVGNTRFDVSGGSASLVTLAVRLARQSTKSSVSGKVMPLNSGKYGAPTGKDVIANFLENKLSPAASVADDLLVRHRTFQGDKPTMANEAENLLVPLPITNYQELKNDPKSANILAAMIADALGIATNTYGKPQKRTATR